MSNSNSSSRQLGFTEVVIIHLLQADGAVCACGGYRIFENLFQGKILYVDDLVSSSSVRSKGE